MMIIVMLTFILAECGNVVYYAKCHCVVKLSVVMMGVVLLNVNMEYVFMLIVVWLSAVLLVVLYKV